MRNLFLALGAATLVVPASMTLPTAKAEAKRHYYAGHSSSRYRHYHRRCRYSSGTTGLVAGGVGGALLGHSVLHGTLGTIAGGVGGAFAGRAIDRGMTADRRCR